MKSIYISLTEAARQCDYSQEYLSLRARQGKLKSKKFGRNWVTTIDWLQDYIRKAEEYNGNGKGTVLITASDKKYAHLQAEVKPKHKEQISRPARPVLPPENLPIGEPVLIFEKILQPSLPQRIILAFALAGFALLVVTGGLLLHFNSGNLSSAAELTREYGMWMDEQFVDTSIIAAQDVAGQVFAGETRIGIAGFTDLVMRVASTVKKDALALRDTIVGGFRSLVGRDEEKQFAAREQSDLPDKTTQLEENILGDIQKRFGEFRQDLGLAEQKSEGLVVLPSTERDEEIKEKISRSFSDEVVIEPQDETSGIIRPIFRKVAEQAYLYMMVPLKN